MRSFLGIVNSSCFPPQLLGFPFVVAMGIPGLLQFIRDASEPISMVKYKGLTVAVDTYCWLHKGAFSCAEKLAKGEATDQ